MCMCILSCVWHVHGMCMACTGCLLGSSAKLLALVLAETAASGYVPPRPFRVNAGPVHQYVLMADGSTRYLSEVSPH